MIEAELLLSERYIDQQLSKGGNKTLFKRISKLRDEVLLKATKAKNPLFDKTSKEWAVLELLVHELALVNSKVEKRSFQECLDEMNNKVRLILRGGTDI